MKIALCGMMGCGKSTIGKVLAQKLAWAFVDTDEWIVRRHGEISAIFEKRGEKYFRDLETDVARELADDGTSAVVSVGGGFVLRAENVELLKKDGRIVLLKANKETLLERLAGDTSRPLLQGEDLSKKLDRLIAARVSAYESACDVSVSVDGKTPDSIADEVLKKLGL